MSKANSNNDFMKELANSFLTGNTDNVVDIITFIEAPWGLSFKPRPAQKFILKCFYGMELDGKDKYIDVRDMLNEKTLFQFTEKEFLQWLYDEGRCNTNEVTGKRFLELDLVLGRRAGKSILTSVISAYELYKLVKRGDPLAYYGMPPQDSIYILNVAPTDPQAEIIFGQTRKLAQTCPFTSNRVINPTQEYFSVQTDSDLIRNIKKIASIEVISGGCASNALRGRNAIMVALDEMAFFIDNNGRFSSEEVYKALTPSTSTFHGEGKVICISSPYAKYGKFYTRYQQSFEEQDTTLMFQMYSAMVNPQVDTNHLRVERRRNRTNFMCEFGGEFSDTITAWIDDENQFRQCVKDFQILKRGVVGTTYFMGLDLGLKNDGTAIAITHKDTQKNKIVLDYAEVWYGGQSDVWDKVESLYKNCNRFAKAKDARGQEVPSDRIMIADVVKEIQNLVQWFPLKSGFFDQHNGYGLMESLHAVGLKQFRMETVTDVLNNDMYQLFKDLYSDGLVELPNDEIIIKELLSLQAEKKSKNKTMVRAPEKNGAHDDLSDAVAASIYECFNHYHGSPAKITSLVGGGKQVVGGQASEGNHTLFQMGKIMKHGLNPSRMGKGNMRGSRYKFL